MRSDTIAGSGATAAGRPTTGGYNGKKRLISREIRRFTFTLRRTSDIKKHFFTKIAQILKNVQKRYIKKVYKESGFAASKRYHRGERFTDMNATFLDGYIKVSVLIALIDAALAIKSFQ